MLADRRPVLGSLALPKNAAGGAFHSPNFLANMGTADAFGKLPGRNIVGDFVILTSDREPVLRQMEKDFGIIRPELTVLMCLNFRADVHARDICEVTEQPSNTVSRAVGSLEKKGLIQRTKDSVDTRRQVLNITPEGRAAHDKVIALFAHAENKMLAGLTPGEQDELRNLLDKVARSVEAWKP